MRYCPICKTSKEEGEFNRKSNVYLQHKCRSCQSSYAKIHYKNNKEKYLKKNKKRANKLRELIAKLKNKPCTDCGGKFPPCVMDFDHTDDNKSFTIGQKFLSSSWKLILLEIGKCELVCANCHRIRTHNRRTGGGMVTQGPAKPRMGVRSSPGSPIQEKDNENRKVQVLWVYQAED